MSFFVGLCFIRDETISSFMFPLHLIRALYDRLQLSYPEAVFTDKDDGLRRALLLTFPNSARLLCHWHIFNNIKGAFSTAFRGEVAIEIEERLRESGQHEGAGRRRSERNHQKVSRAKKPLERVYMDLWGPYKRFNIDDLNKSYREEHEREERRHSAPVYPSRPPPPDYLVNPILPPALGPQVQ